MKTKTHYRQGDVLIQHVANIPIAIQKRQPENGPIILAHGEVTGHHHSIEIDDRDAADWWKSDDGNQQLVNLSAPAKVVHQEHAAIDLPAGTYRITRQREYSPEAIRNVAD